LDDTDSQPAELPSGTITFLFTDIEGSTRLERELREGYGDVLGEHQRLLRQAFERYHGREIDTQGDSFFVVFPRARDAVAAAVQVQRELESHPWPDGRRVRVRIGMHTGEASLSDGRYVGLAVVRAARISAAGHGGQTLLSGSTRDVVEDDLPAEQRLHDLGDHRLKDLPRPERVFQLVTEGLESDFPPLKTPEEQELAEAAVVVLAPPWWRRARFVGLLAGVAAAVVVVGALLGKGASEAGATEVRANALGLIDPGSGKIEGEIPVDAAPTGVARGEGAVWVTNANDGTVSRIDSVGRSVRQTIDVGNSPGGIAVGAGAVWVTNHDDGTVSRIEPETNEVVQTIEVGNGPIAVAFGEGAVWVTNSADRTLSRIDPDSGDVVKTIETDAVGRGLAVGGGSVWITDESSRRVIRVDPRTNEVADEISVGNGPTGIAFGERAVWVANTIDGTVSRIDPANATVTATTSVPGGPGAIGVFGGHVWVSAEFGERVVRIDAVDATVIDAVAIGNRPKGVVVSDEGVWVAVQESGRGHRGGRLIVLSGALDSIDPAIANNTFSALVLSLVYDGLTGFRRVGGSEGTQLVPNLAMSIPSPRDGGKTYTFRLRPGLRYANGDLVRPRDLRRALERIFELGSPPSEQPGLAAVAGAERCAKGLRCDLSRGIVTRGDSITFQLSEPTPSFLFDVSNVYPIPPGTPQRDVGTKPVPGTGPYLIESYVPGRQLTFIRNPHFRVWSEAARPDGNAEEIIFRIVPENDERFVSSVAQGRADIALFLPTERIPEVKRRFARQLHVVPERATVFLFLNTKRPPFDDIRVRRALNYAVDRRRVVELHGGTAVAQLTCQVVGPTLPGYVRYCPHTLEPSRSGEWTAPDRARAQQLIAASGTAGEKITVWTFPYFAPEGRYIVSLLSGLGYRARLKEVKDIATYFAIINDPKTQAQSGIAGWYGASLGFQSLSTLTCDFFGNWAKFCDREIDRQLQSSLRLLGTDPRAAARMWARIDRQLVDRAPWVPLYTPRTPYFVSKRIGNWQYHPYHLILLDQLWVR